MIVNKAGIPRFSSLQIDLGPTKNNKNELTISFHVQNESVFQKNENRRNKIYINELDCWDDPSVGKLVDYFEKIGYRKQISVDDPKLSAPIQIINKAVRDSKLHQLVQDLPIPQNLKFLFIAAFNGNELETYQDKVSAHVQTTSDMG